MISARRQFLDAFLGALGATEILDYLEGDDFVRGTVRYADDSELLDLSGHADDEFQDFLWKIPESAAPSLLIYQIADLIHRYHLLHIDKLRVSRDTLFSFLLNDLEASTARADFEAALEALEAIEIPMVENGVETADCYFIHE
jgi:hypothetical protein